MDTLGKVWNAYTTEVKNFTKVGTKLLSGFSRGAVQHDLFMLKALCNLTFFLLVLYCSSLANAET